MKKRYSLAAVLSVILLTAILCTGVSAVDIPAPSESFYVYDEAEVLSESTEKHIISENILLEELTGAQIVIATVKTTGDTTIREFAGEMFTQWRIGDEEKHNGVLVLLAIDDDDYWVTQGSGIEKHLSSGDIKTKLDKYLEPYFAAKSYDDGITGLFNNLITTFEGIYTVDVETTAVTDENGDPVEQNDGDKARAIIWVMLVVLVLVVAGVIFLAATSRRRAAARYLRLPMGGRPGVHIGPGGMNNRRLGPSRSGPRPGPRPGGMGRGPGASRPGMGRPSVGPRPGGSPRPGQRPGGMGGSRPGNRPSGSSRPRSGGGGSTRGGGAGRR